MDNLEEKKAELEEQFILRLPMNEALHLRSLLNSKPEKIKKTLKIDLQPEKHQGKVHVGKTKLNARLKKFPTIIESYKTNIVNNDKAMMFKTADICHMLDCTYEETHKNYEIIDGYTPPMKNVKKKRFRKTLVNPDLAEEAEMVSKELYYLLSTDLEASSTRFEIMYEENKRSRTDQNHNEMLLFGNVSTDSDIDIELESGLN